MKDQTKEQLREKAARTICNIRRGSMDDKQFKATIEFQIDSLLQSQRDELVEKEIMRFMEEIQERANKIPPGLLLNEVVNYAYDRVSELKSIQPK